MDASRDLRPGELRCGAAGLNAWFWGLLLVLIDFHIGAKPNLHTDLFADPIGWGLIWFGAARLSSAGWHPRLIGPLAVVGLGSSAWCWLASGIGSSIQVPDTVQGVATWIAPLPIGFVVAAVAKECDAARIKRLVLVSALVLIFLPVVSFAVRGASGALGLGLDWSRGNPEPAKVVILIVTFVAVVGAVVVLLSAVLQTIQALRLAASVADRIRTAAQLAERGQFALPVK
jgi:hypothetical protein